MHNFAQILKFVGIFILSFTVLFSFPIFADNKHGKHGKGHLYNKHNKLKGKISTVIGLNSFTVKDQRVCYDDHTKFKKGDFQDINYGRFVEVKAHRRNKHGHHDKIHPDSLCAGFEGIYAREIKFKKRKDDETQYAMVSGGGVKGPLAHAVVSAYEFDSLELDFRSSTVHLGQTNSEAKIIDLALPFPLQDIYIAEFSSTEAVYDTDGTTILQPATFDVSTGLAPVITVMRTVITQTMLNSGEQIYATPLTTLAIDLAIINARNANTIIDPDTGLDVYTPVSAAQFIAALSDAQLIVKSTLGFGLADSIDIFSTPPLITTSTTSEDAQQATTDYRSAVEAVTAIVYQMQQVTGDEDVDTNDILSDLGSDLSDGEIDGEVINADGSVSELSYPDESLNVLEQDPNTLPIPNTDQTVADIVAVLENEQTFTEPTPIVVVSSSSELLEAETDPDFDGDGVLNAEDAFPYNPALQSIGQGTDTDGDNWISVLDAEGVQIGQDPDDNDADNPGLVFVDSDGDGLANNGGANPDIDDDNDGLTDDEEEAISTNPLVKDTDGDGVYDGADDWPLDSALTFDSDFDMIGNAVDNCAFVVNLDQADFDNDLIGDACDEDDDNDSVIDTLDNCPLLANTDQADLDGDLIGDACDEDDDNDSVIDTLDNCPLLVNTDQADFDSDLIGDACDEDDDNDSVIDTLDNCPLLVNIDQADFDSDLIGDACDEDDDNDSVIDTLDNCPLLVNTDQADLDGDLIGDACDGDIDGDTVLNDDDAFPTDASETVDTDADGVGDNSDIFPNDPTETIDSDADGVGDNADAFPFDNTETVDTDGDGVGDNSDLAPNDANIGGALTFTSAELGSSYVALLDGALTNPTRPLGTGFGDRYDFDGTDSGYHAGNTEGVNFTYSFANDALNITQDNSVAIYAFSYDFIPTDGKSWTTARLFGQIEGIIDPSDVSGDTIIIQRFISATLSRDGLADYDYGAAWDNKFNSLAGDSSDNAGFARMSLSGLNNNFRVCANGFVQPIVEPAVDLYDCPFSADGAGGFGWTAEFFDGIWLSAADGLEGELCEDNGCRVTNLLSAEEVASDSINGWSLTPIHVVSDNPRVSQLLERGVISQVSADAFIATNGDIQVAVSIVTVSQEWQLLESNAAEDRFYVTTINRYVIVDDFEREQLLGDINAEPVEGIISAPEELRLTHNSSITIIPWTEAELVENQWVMNSNYDPDHSDGFSRLTSDIVTFTGNGDGTGTANNQISGQSFSWSINGSGVLIVDYQDSNVSGNPDRSIRLEKFELYDESLGILTAASRAGQTIASFTLAMAFDPSASVQPLRNQYLMGAFSLTDPKDYDEFGEVLDTSYFGFRLEDDGRATRIWHGEFNLAEYKNGWDYWYWSENITNEVTLEGRWFNGDSGWNAECDKADDQCNRWRIRHWQPIKQVGERVYVLEWEERNHNTWTFPSIEENTYVTIKPRINFYQAFDIDSDGDGEFDATDADDDNDGTLDVDDAWPFDASEQFDSDGDGVGDNADAFPNDAAETVDTDGDGSGDNSDLDPNDPVVGQAQAFSGTDLKASSLFISQGRLSEPSYRLGATSGDQFNFDVSNNGQHITSTAAIDFTYSFTNDELELLISAPIEQDTYLEPWQLVEMGVITQQAADDFVAANGSYQLHLKYAVSSRNWLLSSSDATTQVYWQTTTTDYQFVEQWEQEQLIGLENSIVQLDESEALILSDVAALTVHSFTNEEIAGNSWAMPIALNEFTSEPNELLTADIANFNIDGVNGTAAVSGASFTWAIVNDSLELTYENGGVVKLTRFQNFAAIDEVLVEVNSAGMTTSSYALAVPYSGAATLDPLFHQFAMNSFTLTNPDAFDGEGNVDANAVFGYRLELGGKATRIWSKTPDLNNYKSGWDNWDWQWTNFGAVEMTAYLDGNGSWHSDCDRADINCSPLRKRTWLPLKEVANRVYVIEYEYFNDNAWNYGEEPVWRNNIGARIQFYETFDLGLDSDNDGITDSEDDDLDGDGTLNGADAFPLDPDEQLDSDNDGVGNNADAFPNDATETVDTDGDGVGDNSDIDANNPLISTVQSFDASLLSTKYVKRTPSNIGQPQHQNWGNAVVHFNADGSGKNITDNNDSVSSFSWMFNGNSLDVTQGQGPQLWFNTVQELVNLGVATQAQVDSYLETNADIGSWHSIDVFSSVQQYQLLNNDSDEDIFLVEATSQIQISDADLHQAIFGLGAGEQTASNSKFETWFDIDNAPIMAFDSSEFNEQAWAFRALPGASLQADIFNFNGDATGNTQLSGLSFSWQLIDGSVELSFDDIDGNNTPATINLTRFNAFAAGAEVYAEVDTNGVLLTDYLIAIPDTDANDVSKYVGGFLDSETSHQNDYLENGEHILNIWGMVLNAEMSVDNLNFYGSQYTGGGYQYGIQRRFWQLDNDGNVIITRHLDDNGNNASDCEADAPNCVPLFKRTWQPLNTDGDRLYVLEWEELLDNHQDFPATEAEYQWSMRIAPRVTFYRLRDLYNGFSDQLVNLSIRDQLGLNLDTPLTQDIIDNVTHLNFNGAEIYSLAGLEIFQNLQTIDLGNTQLTDLSPLHNLPNLTEVYLDGHVITDNNLIQPLLDSGINVHGNYVVIAPSYQERQKSNLNGPYHTAGGGNYRFYGDGNGHIFNTTLHTQVYFQYSWQENGFILETNGLPNASLWVRSVNELVGVIIDQQMADDYIANHGDFGDWREVTVESSRQSFNRAQDTNDEDTFDVLSVYRYRVADGFIHDELFGQGAGAIESEQPWATVHLVDTQNASRLALGTVELDDQQLAMVAMPGDQLTADVFQFNSDGTGSTQVNGATFTWAALEDGQVQLDFTDIGDGRTGQVWLSAYEQFDQGYEVYVNAEVDGWPIATYSYAIFEDGNDDFSGYIDTYLDSEVNHHNDYLENGEHRLDIWGFQLNSDGVADNFSFAGRDYTGDGSNFSTNSLTRYWQQVAGELELTVRFQNGNFANCDLADADCRVSRRRTWQPIANDGSRLWVMESETWLMNVWDNPAEQDEDWLMRIPPRLTVYKVRDIYTPFADRMMNLAVRNELGLSLDAVIDVESITQLLLQDYPITSLEGVQQLTNLTELVLANSQVSDLSPLFTLTNLSEINVDNIPLADLNQLDTLTALFPGITIIGSPAILVSSLSFADAELQACVNEQGVEYVSDFTGLDCSDRPITNISDIAKLTHLDYIGLNNIQGIADYSALAHIGTLQNVDVWNSSFSDSDFAAFANHPNIRHFGAGDAQITNIAAAASMPNLQSLHLWGDETRVYDLSVLTDLANFTSLALASNQVWDVNVLAQLTQLQQLWFNGNLSAADVQVVSSLTNLQHLAVGWSNSIINPVFEQLIYGLHNLTSLEISGSQVTSLHALPDALPNLQQLHIQWSKVRDLSPLYGLSQLNYLNVDQTPVLDSGQVDELVISGVQIDGAINPGPLLANIEYGDESLRMCIDEYIAEHANGLTYAVELEGLDCSNRNINSLSGLEFFTHLTWLGLNNNQAMYDQWVFSSLTVLDSIDVWGSSFDNGGLEAFNHNYSLSHIGAGDAQITDISAAANIPNLRGMHLWGAEDRVYDISVLQHLANFETLALARNQVSDINHLSLLNNLAHLWLHGSLSVQDQAVILAMTNLRHLSVGFDETMGNGFFNQITTTLTNLNSLEYAWAGLTDLSSISNLPSLTELYIGGNPLSDISAVSHLTQLTHLGLENTNISDLTILPSLPLVWININDAFIHDPAIIQQLVDNEVYIEGTALAGELLTTLSFSDTELQNCVNDHSNGILTTTQLTHLNCSDRAIVNITGIEQLTHLDSAHFNNVNQIADFTSLALISSLRELGVDNTQFDNSDFAAFSGHGTFENLWVNWSQLSDISDAANIPNLATLHISSDLSFDPSPLVNSNLRSIGFNRHQVANLDFVLSLTSLNDFNMQGDMSFADIELIASLSQLEYLGLGSADILTNETFNQIIYALPNLRSLGFGGSHLVNIDELPNALPNLEQLHIYWSKVKDLSPLFVMSQLNYVNIDNSPILDASQLGILANNNVHVDGPINLGLLLTEIDYSDDNLRLCIEDHTVGLTYAVELEWLDCTARSLNSLNGLDKFTHLKWLMLNDNIAMFDQWTLSNLKVLESLDVWNSAFDNGGLEALNNNYSLRNIGLGGSLVNTLDATPNIPNLASLHMWGAQVYDLNPLTTLANFNQLALERAQVADITVIPLLNNLDHLWLNGDLTAGDIIEIQKLTNLKHLSLAWNSYMSNELLAQFITNSPTIEGLGIEHTLITDLSSLFVDNSYDALVTPLNNINIDGLSAIVDGELELQVQALIDMAVDVQGSLAY